jgi:hypothetical protein
MGQGVRFLLRIRESGMSILIKLSPSFSEYADKHNTIEVAGKTVSESLEGLIAQYPIFKELLFDYQHSLTALILYQGEVIVQNQLDRKIEDHQEITVLPMVYGG